MDTSTDPAHIPHGGCQGNIIYGVIDEDGYANFASPDDVIHIADTWLFTNITGFMCGFHASQFHMLVVCLCLDIFVF